MCRGQCREEKSKISVNFLIHVVESLSDCLLEFQLVLLVVIDLLLKSQISFPEESELIVVIHSARFAMDELLVIDVDTVWHVIGAPIYIRRVEVLVRTKNIAEKRMVHFVMKLRILGNIEAKRAVCV